MPQHEIPSAAGDTLTIEAPTVEDALTQVTDELGPSAQIIDARKVQRGGIKGFFAKEVVQLTARKPNDGRSDIDEAAAAERRSKLPVDRGLEALLAGVESGDGEPSFSTFLKRELGPDLDSLETAVTGETDTTNESAHNGHHLADAADGEPTPQAVGPLTRQTEPANEDPRPPSAGADQQQSAAPDTRAATWRLQHPDPGAPAGVGPIGWSTTALARLGLPEIVLAAVNGLDPADDLGWINAIAGVAADFCGPVSDAPALIAGPNADRIGEVVGIPAIFPPTMPPYAGSVTAVVASDPKETAWLEYVIGHRDLHLVIGDEDWRGALVTDPATVSWVGDIGVVDALYLCATLNAKLGYGTVDGTLSAPIRVRPIDVALAVRRLVGRR